MPTRTTAALCFVEYDSANNVLRLIPVNNLGNAKVAAAYADASALTTVAHNLSEDAGRAGYGQTSGPYSVYRLTFS